MKHLGKLVAILLFFYSFPSLGQDKFDITIAGIKPETESAILPDDIIMSWFGFNNIAIRARNKDKGKEEWALSASKTYQPVYSATDKHYTMSVKYEVKASKWLDINKPMVIRVAAFTSFGNAIWWEQECTKDMVSPIILDHYSKIEGSMDKPSAKGIYVHFNGFADALKPIMASLPEDKTVSQSPIIFEARNEGASGWPVNFQINYYFSPTANFNLAFETADKIDFTKKIEYRFAVKTLYGNYYWIETSNTSDMIFKPLKITQYTGEPFVAGSPLKTTPVKDNSIVIPLPITNTTSNKTNTSTTPANTNATAPGNSNPNSSSPVSTMATEAASNSNANVAVASTKNATVVNDGNVTSAPVNPKTNAPEPTNTSGRTNAGITAPVPSNTVAASTTNSAANTTANNAPAVSDNTVNFTTHKGKLKISNSSVPTQGSVASTLETDGTISVGGPTNQQSFNLKGGKPIQYNPSEGYVIQAVSNGEQVYNSKNGPITIADGSTLIFSKNYLAAASLAKNAVLNVNGIDVPAAKGSGAAGAFDVGFDESGELTMATLSSKVVFQISGQPYPLDAGSKVNLKSGGKFSEIASYSNISVSVNNIAYMVKGSEGKSPNIFFNTKSQGVYKLVVTGANTVTVEGVAIPVEDGSWISFTEDNTGVVVDQFHIGKEMTIKVYKKEKVKETNVKVGKRVTLENGKITKVSLF